jgi:hypothetical protein
MSSSESLIHPFLLGMSQTNRTAVASSNLASIGYNEELKMLEIEFHNGAIYQFFQVPEEISKELLLASSPGHYFSVWIRNRYSYKRVK